MIEQELFRTSHRLIVKGAKQNAEFSLWFDVRIFILADNRMFLVNKIKLA